MPFRRIVVAFLFLAAGGRAAEIKTLKGETLTADVAEINGKEVTLARGAERSVMPLQQILQIEFAPLAKPPADGQFADVELVDGSVLHCNSVAFKEKNVEMKLLTGQQIKLPLTAVANFLQDAQDEKKRKDWTERLAKKRRRDVLALLRDGVVNPIEGTLGDGDAEGKTIEFTLASGRKAPVPLANVHGLIFQRGADPSAPPVICKLYDSFQDLIYVSGLMGTSSGMTATTPSGAKIELSAAQLTRLDFSTDKLAFLSDLEPGRVNETSTEDRIEHYRRDKNLDDGPIRLGGVTYAKGVSLHATTALEYDLKGDFREFRAIVGIDDSVGGLDGPTVVKIEGDGQELYAATFSRKDKERFRPVTLNIKNVQKLKITVNSGDLLDLGKHLSLADAKVSK